MRRHVLIFFACGIPFGLWGWLIFGARAGVLMGLLFGAGMVFGLWGVGALINRGKPERVRTGGPRHQDTVKLDLDPTQAFERCSSALKAFGANIRSADRKSLRIEANTRTTIKSWGERLTLTLIPVSDKATEITVRSVPAWPLTLVDYGKAVENVESIIGHLTRRPGDLNG